MGVGSLAVANAANMLLCDRGPIRAIQALQRGVPLPHGLSVRRRGILLDRSTFPIDLIFDDHHPEAPQQD